MPPALTPGDRIRVVSPAGPVDPVRLADGVKRLEAWGYEVEFAPHALERDGFLSAPDADRLRGLTEALFDPRVSAVICSRGGYGVLRLLDRLPWDEISRRPVKSFVGFSDISAFQLVLWERCGWVSFSGPQAAMALSGGISERSAMHLRGMLDGSWRSLSWRNGDDLTLKPVIRSGSATGTILPCNLSMLVSLVGTQFMPDLDGAVLCLEDIDEPPYRIDRMFWQLEKSGRMNGISAMILGAFTLKGKSLSDDASASVSDLFRDYRFPIWRDLPYGHIDDRITIPVGSSVMITEAGLINIVEHDA